MEARTEPISGWILEFLLRNPNLEALAKKSLSVLPIPAGDPRLKKIVLLRTIECEVTDGIVTESTLKALELLAELDSRRGVVVGDAMKTAYAAVAVDLTVRFLVGCGGKPGLKYMNALKRVWRVRVEGLESSAGSRSELLTREFLRWWDLLEAAISDDSACRRLMGLNTRNDAVAAVRAYLKEAWVLVGKPLINYGVRLMNQDVKQGEGSDWVSRGEEKSPDKGMSLVGLVELTKKVNFEALNCGDEVAVTLPDSRASNCKEIRKVKVLRQSIKHIVRRPNGPLRISDDENSNTHILNTYDAIPTPEVCNAKESLKSNMMKLKNAVTDPLPEAVHVAETVISELGFVRNRSVRETEEANLSSRLGQPSDANLGSQRDPVTQSIATDANLGKPSRSQQDDVSEPVTTDANLGKPSYGQQNDVSRPSTTDSNPGNPSGSQQNGGSRPVNGAANIWQPSCSNQNGVPRPSLMERNSTACKLEWDDSPDENPEAMVDRKSRLHIPIPKKRRVSPLKQYEPTKLLMRRKIRRWSLLEEDTLRTGVQMFGKGNWKLILHTYRDVFDQRTEVDLKDKWRNLTR